MAQPKTQFFTESDEEEYRRPGYRQKQKRHRQSRSTISNNETTAAVASIAQEPKERPDAKHHLKVRESTYFTAVDSCRSGFANLLQPFLSAKHAGTP